MREPLVETQNFLKARDFDEYLHVSKRHPSKLTPEAKERLLEVIEYKLYSGVSSRKELDRVIFNPTPELNIKVLFERITEMWGPPSGEEEGVIRHQVDAWKDYVKNPTLETESPKRNLKKYCDNENSLKQWLCTIAGKIDKNDLSISTEPVILQTDCVVFSEGRSFTATPPWPPLNSHGGESEFHAYLKSVTKNYLWLRDGIEPHEEITFNYAEQPGDYAIIRRPDLSTPYTHAEVGQTSAESIFYPLYFGLDVLWVPYPRNRTKSLRKKSFTGYICSLAADG